MDLGPEFVNCHLLVSLVPREQLLAGARSSSHAAVVTWEGRTLQSLYLTLKPKAVLSPRVLASAVLRAWHNHESNLHKANSFEHEVVRCLSSQWEMDKALKRFVADDSTEEVLVVEIGEDKTKAQLASWTPDEAAIQKYYGVSDSELRLPGGLEAAVLSRISMEGL